jgi:hypothetical protein
LCCVEVEVEVVGVDVEREIVDCKLEEGVL